MDRGSGRHLMDIETWQVFSQLTRMAFGFVDVDDYVEVDESESMTLQFEGLD